MSATANSTKYQSVCHILALTLAGAVGFAICICRGADEVEDATNSPGRFVLYSQGIYAQAQKRYEIEPTNNVAAWEFARAAYDRAEFSTNDTERAALAIQGIAACRQVLKNDPKCVSAHYYLGLNLGQLARTKMLGALPLVDEMESGFKRARELDEDFDYAGPDRFLGRLYFEAPGWPASVGSKSKARHHLQRAATLAPDYPANRLNLIKAFLRWNETTSARRELKTLETLWPTAKTNFTGEAWAATWAEWEADLNQVKEKLKVGK